jgi:TetR/AcrR family transcriptional repressor of nem operon
MTKLAIRTQILDVAEGLTQSKGYNAFSYKDISALVGVKTSSIHYHFPTKADLGQTVVKRYIDTLSVTLEQVLENHQLSCKKKLEYFIDTIVENTYSADRKMCLGGMFASDVLTLPHEIQKEVQQFFTRLSDWLNRLLILGLKDKVFCVEKKDIPQEVMLILSLLEGSLLLARLYHKTTHLVLAKQSILTRIAYDKSKFSE